MRGHITKKGNRYYAVLDVPTAPGAPRKQKWLSGFATRREAEAALAATVVEIHSGRYVEPSALALKDYLLDEWLPASAARVRPSTLVSYRQLIRTHVVPGLGHLPLRDVTPLGLTKFYGRLLADGRVDGKGGLSPRTVRYLHAVLRRALADAVRWRYLAINPSDGAQPPSASAARAPEMRTWTVAEVQEFLRFTADDDHHIAYVLAVGCGLRRGEVCGLRWQDVELDGAATLRVRQQLVDSDYQLRFSEPKTAAGRRTVALDDGTVALLRRHRMRQREQRLALGLRVTSADLVVARPDGAPVHPSNFGQTFNLRVRDAGLPRIRFHDLRHTHATLAIAAGIHPKIVSERLGHASTSFTLDVYSHAMPSMQADAAQSIGRLLYGDATTTKPGGEPQGTSAGCL